MLYYILLWMHVCFCCIGFSFSLLSQEIGWEERLQNDLFCRVGRKTLTQSILKEELFFPLCRLSNASTIKWVTLHCFTNFIFVWCRIVTEYKRFYVDMYVAIS